MDRTAPDADPVETREWLDPPEGVTEVEGRDRAAFLLDEPIGRARPARCCSTGKATRSGSG